MTFAFTPLQPMTTEIGNDLGIDGPGIQAAFYKQEIATLRRLHPEIDHWDDCAIQTAWSAYSRDIYTVAWVTTDWLLDNHSGFLAYIFLSTKMPVVDFGSPGSLESFLWRVADVAPWKSRKPACPPSRQLEAA